MFQHVFSFRMQLLRSLVLEHVRTLTCWQEVEGAPPTETLSRSHVGKGGCSIAQQDLKIEPPVKD